MATFLIHPVTTLLKTHDTIEGKLNGSFFANTLQLSFTIHSLFGGQPLIFSIRTALAA